MTTPEFQKLSAQMKTMFSSFKGAFPWPADAYLSCESKWKLDPTARPSTAETATVCNVEARIDSAADFMDTARDIVTKSTISCDDVSKIMEQVNNNEFLTDICMPGPPFLMRMGLSTLAAAGLLEEAKPLMYNLLKTITAMMQKQSTWIIADKKYTDITEHIDDLKIEQSVFETFEEGDDVAAEAKKGIETAMADLETVDCDMKSAYLTVQEINKFEEVDAIVKKSTDNRAYLDKMKLYYDLQRDPEAEKLEEAMLQSMLEAEKVLMEPLEDDAEAERKDEEILQTMFSAGGLYVNRAMEDKMMGEAITSAIAGVQELVKSG